MIKGARNLPTFIGIGAPRSGTTWLFRCLQEHPEVFLAEVKETNFFDYGTIEGRLPEYQAHFAKARGARAVGEISVRYLGSRRAPEGVGDILPAARLFVSLRNPVDQVYSHYWHLRRQNFHEWTMKSLPRTFEEALELYGERLLEPARYPEHLARWLRVFDPKQLHVIFYDDIQADPAGVVQSLYVFLEVDESLMPRSVTARRSDSRRGSSPRSASADWIWQRLYGKLNRYVYYPLKHAIGTRSAERIKRDLRVREVMDGLFQNRGYPDMQVETRRALREHFAADVEKLELLTRRSLGHWK